MKIIDIAALLGLKKSLEHVEYFSGSLPLPVVFGAIFFYDYQNLYVSSFPKIKNKYNIFIYKGWS